MSLANDVSEDGPPSGIAVQKRVATKKRPQTRSVGSIRPYGPNGSKGFRVRLAIGTMSDGRRAQFDEIAPTRQAAKALLEEFRQRKASPDFNGSAETMTLDGWIEEFFKLWSDHLRPRTKASYRQVLDLYVPDTLKALPLARISTRAVQAWLKDLSMQEKAARGKKSDASTTLPALLSARTVAYCRASLRLVIQKAVELGMLENNVVKNTKLSSASSRRDSTGNSTILDDGRKMRTLTEDEVSRFLIAAAARTAKLDGTEMESYRDRLAPFWRLALETGLRPSELLGLKWSNVRLDAVAEDNGSVSKPSVTVTHSLTSADGDGVLDPPKTKRSIRTVPLSTSCVKLLQTQRKRQALDRLSLGEAYRPLDFVFATGVGTPMDINNVRNQAFLPLLKTAGIEHRRLYDLRHTAITHMLSNGVPVTVVSERAGHASVKMTLDVYSHVLPGQQDEATEMMGALLDRLNTTLV